MKVFKDCSLTVTLLLMFLVVYVGQIVTGFHDYNSDRRDEGMPPVDALAYLHSGHLWEATFENWESEFLQMAVFVLLTTFLVQKGSPESRSGAGKEAVDADPRDHADEPNVPWPVKRGGWILRVYENSLGLAFVLLFLFSWAGHAAGGFAIFRETELAHGRFALELSDYLSSSQFWFESFQNWQSEFLSIAAMVWLAVYLRQRHSPESKPVHTPHGEQE